MARKVFVSWSGDLGRRLAEALKVTILDDGALDVWVSSENIAAGEPWFNEIERAAQDCEVAIGCVTPGAVARPWFNFEAGMLYGRLRNFKLLLIGEQLGGPLAWLQGIDGTDQKKVEELLKSLMTDPQRVQRHLKDRFPEWQREVTEALRDYAAELETRRPADDLSSQLAAVSRNPVVLANDCLRKLVGHFLGEVRDNLALRDDTFSASQLQYPHHLIHLQRVARARVRALALLQQEEQFWQKSIGHEILNTVHPQSHRVFIVRTADQLEEHWDTLLKHARAYKVGVLSYDELARRFEDKYVRDFSVISSGDANIVALYDKDPRAAGRILYRASQAVVDDYSTAFEDVARRAVTLDSHDAHCQTMVAEVFADRALVRLAKRNIEMSLYVPLDDYDKHEEDHAYYRDMMDEMLRIFRSRIAALPAADDHDGIRVLEMGAGTGIFTRRLAALPEIAGVVALEIDWACFHKLHHSVAGLASVRACNEDSRTFSPTGQFCAVFSSFAEHHIRPEDKRDYLRNVRRNLMPGGLFIVGDEFIPAHEPDDAAWAAALTAYHQHIIELANASGNAVLARLEAASLRSGLDRVGDFKMTCAQYEKHLHDAGFTFSRTKIGPADPELERRVGGVYVYACSIAAGSGRTG